MEYTAEKRDPALDALRALAIILVLTIHASSNGFTHPPGSLDWWGTLLWAGPARPAVPLFFMCSGALMLSRDIPPKRLFSHNVLRILIAMLCWAALYKLIAMFLHGGVTLAGL